MAAGSTAVLAVAQEAGNSGNISGGSGGGKNIGADSGENRSSGGGGYR